MRTSENLTACNFFLLTDGDEAGDYVVPHVLSPRDRVFRPDIGNKLYHHCM